MSADTRVAGLERELRETRHAFRLRWKADMRAIARWREGHPERELVMPDHADLVVWLLERLEERERTLGEVRDVWLAIERAGQNPDAIHVELRNVAAAMARQVDIALTGQEGGHG